MTEHYSLGKFVGPCLKKKRQVQPLMAYLPIVIPYPGASRVPHFSTDKRLPTSWIAINSQLFSDNSLSESREKKSPVFHGVVIFLLLLGSMSKS